MEYFNSLEILLAKVIQQLNFHTIIYYLYNYITVYNVFSS